jgi:nitrous oxide reductase accessory protein NosL
VVTFYRWLLITLGVLMWLSGGASAAPPDQIPKPGDRDLCPVCGMLVAKYPNWIAIVVYRDGHAHFFDGAKDLFKYLGNRPQVCARTQGSLTLSASGSPSSMG